MILVELQTSHQLQLRLICVIKGRIFFVDTACWSKWYKQRNKQRTFAFLYNHHALDRVRISTLVCKGVTGSHCRALCLCASPKVIQVKIVQGLANVVEVESRLPFAKHLQDYVSLETQIEIFDHTCLSFVAWHEQIDILTDHIVDDLRIGHALDHLCLPLITILLIVERIGSSFSTCVRLLNGTYNEIKAFFTHLLLQVSQCLFHHTHDSLF